MQLSPLKAHIFLNITLKFQLQICIYFGSYSRKCTYFGLIFNTFEIIRGKTGETTFFLGGGWRQASPPLAPQLPIGHSVIVHFSLKLNFAILNISKLSTHFRKIIYGSYSKLSKELKNGIEILVGQVVYKLWINIFNLFFGSITQEPLDLLNVDAIFEFLGQFTTRCIHYISKRR